MKELLKRFAEKYHLEEIANELESLNRAIPVSIGFLGEFNSGKSTLINAMLGERLLPAMEVPTSKSIVEIEISENINHREFLERTKEGNLSPINQSDFRDIALGKREGTAICLAGSNDILKDGFKIIDTPGLGSLDDTDKDITFGYLQFLDGAVICWNIEKGNPTESFYKFLRKDELRGITDNFLFVLTHAAKKSPAAMEEIRKSVIEGLQKFSDLNISDLESKVNFIDSEEAINSSESHLLEKFVDSFRTNIVDRKQQLVNARMQTILRNINSRILFVLEDRLKNFELSSNEFDVKREYLVNKQRLLKEKVDQEEEKFSLLRIELEGKIANITKQYAGSLAITSNENRKQTILKIVKSIQNVINSSVKSYFEQLSIQLDDFSSIFDRLIINLNNIDQIADTCKMIGTAVLTAVVLPGSSVVATTGEAVAGGAAQQMGKQLPKEVVKQIGNEVTKQTLKGILQKSLVIFSEVFKKVNPVEHIGDFISSKYKEKSLDSMLRTISSQISENVVTQVKGIFSTEIIRPIENELDDLRNSLEIVRKEKAQSIEEQLVIKEQLQRDINTLKRSNY